MVLLHLIKQQEEKYIDASSKKRMKVLKSMEGEGFFNTMRGEMVNVFLIIQEYGLLLDGKAHLMIKVGII